MERNRILIVDDEALFLASIKDHLQLTYPGLEVATAANGVEALKVLEKKKFDLVATDVRMPEVDGLDLLAGIVSAGLKIPVIVLSAYINARVEEQAWAHGAFAVLDKPVDLVEFGEAIHRGLTGCGEGSLQGMSISSFLQLLALERKSCRLDLSSEAGCACVYLRRGDVVHAELGEIQGKEAALEILGWDSAELRVVREPWKGRRTINVPLTELLLAGARAEEAPGAVAGEEAKLLEPASHVGGVEGVAPALSLDEVLWRLGEVRGLIAAAFLQQAGGKCWTLGSLPGAGLEEAVKDWAESLEHEASGRPGLRGGPSEARWTALTLERHLCILRCLEGGDVLMVVFDRKVANLALALQALAKAARGLQEALEREA